MANSTTVSGSVVTQTDESVANYCTVSGYLRNITSAALRGSYVVFRYISSPAAYSTNVLFTGERHVARADSTGRVSINLLQGSSVKFEIPNRLLDMVRICNIPSTSSADLIDIIFPRVTTMAFDSATESLSAGETKSLTLTGTLSDGESLDVGSAATLASSDSAIVSVSGTTLTAVASGTATISITSFDSDLLSIRQEPDGDAIKVFNESSPTITATVTVTVS